MRHLWVWLGLAFYVGANATGLLGWLGLAMLVAVWWWVPRATGVLLVAGAAGGLASAGAAAWADDAPGRPPEVSRGTVESVRLRADRAEVVVAPDFAPGHRVVARLPRWRLGFAAGARVRLSGPFRRARVAANPGDFDAQAYDALRRVRWRTRHPPDLLTPGSRLSGAVVAVRVEARARLNAVPQPFGAGLLGGLLLGDRALVPPAAGDAFQATGLGHLLAVSGLHVGGLAFVVFGLAGWCARRLDRVHPRRWAALCAIPAALGFVVLAQSPLSAQRAGFMVCVWVAGLLFARRGRPLLLLAGAALVVLAPDPAVARTPGFQLSFGAVAALVVLCHHRGVGGMVTSAAIATAATAPTIAWHFGVWAPVSVVANVLLTPLAATILVPLGLLGLAVEPLTQVPLLAAAHLAELTVAVAEVLATATGGLRIVGWFAAPVLAIPIALVIVLRGAPTSPGRLSVAAAVAGALLLTSTQLRPAGPTVEFVAVGQGDAILLRDGPRAALVDAGPDPQARTLLPYLRRQGIAGLDLAVVTHTHPDHYAGLAAIIRAMPVARVVTNGRRSRAHAWQHLERTLSKHHLEPTVASGRVSLGGFTLQLGVPHPQGGENDASVTLLAQTATGSILLTGDLEAAGEAALLGLHSTPVTVLKAAHHGSRTSSNETLLDTLCPAAAVFTVGPHNRYRFPHAEVRRRYRAREVAMWRTDLDGRVLVHLGEAPYVEALRRPRVALPLSPRCAPSRARGSPVPLIRGPGGARGPSHGGGHDPPRAVRAVALAPPSPPRRSTVLLASGTPTTRRASGGPMRCTSPGSLRQEYRG